MPHTKKFKKMLHSMEDFYGKKLGTKIAYATAHKKHWRY